MINFALPTLAVLALTPVIGAVVVPVVVPDTSVGASSETEVEGFSMTKWVDDIIANPNGTHLSPEQAYEAWQTTVANATEPAGTLHKRGIRCNAIRNGEAPSADAVLCINYLARLGTTPCKMSGGGTRFATAGKAEIWGIGGGAPQSSYCQHVARGAGQIMDSCWRSDNTVQGDGNAWGNGYIGVVIVRKGIY